MKGVSQGTCPRDSLSKVDLRQWYLGETEQQAEAAVAKIRNEGAKVEGDGDDAFCKRE